MEALIIGIAIFAVFMGVLYLWENLNSKVREKTYARWDVGEWIGEIFMLLFTVALFFGGLYLVYLGASSDSVVKVVIGLFLAGIGGVLFLEAKKDIKSTIKR